MTPSAAVRVSRVIKADADSLFRAWTDSQDLAHWWRMEGDGWAFAGASLDLRVGGAYRLAMTDPAGQTHVAMGTYREITRPTRLAFTWDWENPVHRVGDTLVTVEFKPVDRDTTEVIITHERFADATRAGRHEQGWMELLHLLERFTTGTGDRT